MLRRLGFYCHSCCSKDIPNYLDHYRYLALNMLFSVEFSPISYSLNTIICMYCYISGWNRKYNCIEMHLSIVLPTLLKHNSSEHSKLTAMIKCNRGIRYHFIEPKLYYLRMLWNCVYNYFYMLWIMWKSLVHTFQEAKLWHFWVFHFFGVFLFL